MGPMFKIARPNKLQTKRIVKFIGQCYDPRLQRYLLRTSPDSVYKSICNAFYNVAQNPDIKLPKIHRQKFSKYHKFIAKLIKPSVSIKKKRSANQKGGGFFLAALLPAVISTALSFLGSSFIKKNNSMAIFKKLKLVDEMELERLIEKQLRQYDPKIHSMALMKKEMDQALARQDLVPEEKLALFHGAQKDLIE